MDIEKRLEYLIKKRAELQSSILKLQKESLGIAASSETMSIENKQVFDITNIDSDYIYEQLKTNKNKAISIKKKNDIVSIEANPKLEKHAYLYFMDYWKVLEITKENTISILFETEEETEIRPLIVFYDQLRKKISHSFFTFNIPVRIDIPENTVYVTLGIRLEAQMKAGLKQIHFNIPTLQDVCDYNFLDSIQGKINQIPISNGGKYYIPYEKPFGLIADQFLFDAYKNAGKCVYITPDNYNENITGLSFIIIASAWHGLNNEWDNMTKPDSEQGKTIFTIIRKAKDNGIPVVFYSKEDPPNYEHFVHIAKECDYIFTSAAEMIEKYKVDCDNEQVYSLCFGINPILHNPIGIRSVESEKGVIFSGSWMVKYPDRIAKLEMMFDGVLDSNIPLKIVDRNFEKNDPRYYFPQKYYEYVSPAIEHEALQKVHKLFEWAININSVTESSTMFANRVYELQAIGNILISNYSKGVAEKFDGVHIVSSSDEVQNVLTSMNDEELYHERVKNIRRVMTGETTFDRIGQIISVIGKEEYILSRKVAVVIPKNNKRLMEEFKNQSYSDRVMISYEELGKRYLDDVDIIAFWNKKFSYGRFYLEDMINAFKYTSCSFVTKQAYFDKTTNRIHSGIEHNYVDEYNSKFATIFWAKDYDIKKLADLPESTKLKNGYSIDHFELTKEK